MAKLRSILAAEGLIKHSKYLGVSDLSHSAREGILIAWGGDLIDLIKAYWGSNLKQIQVREGKTYKIMVEALGQRGVIFEWVALANEDTGVVGLQCRRKGDAGRPMEQTFPASASLKDIVEGMDLLAMKYLKTRTSLS